MEVNCEYVDDCIAYKCYIVGIEISNPNLITKFIGEHLIDRSDDDVVTLTFESCRIKSFPRHLMKFFPNLKVIEIISCDLKELTKEDLKFYPYLRYLGVVDNQLTHLSNDLFEYAPNIQYLDFSCNQIRSIGPRIFDYLDYVYEVNFMKNKCFDKLYDKDFTDLTYKKMVNYIKKHCRPMESLKEIAASKLIESINKQNAVEFFFYGSRFNLYGMKKKAFRYMQSKMMPWLEWRMMNDDPGKLIKMLGIKDFESKRN